MNLVATNGQTGVVPHRPEMTPHGYGSKWVPMDPDSFDQLLPKTTSYHLPEQPAHFTAKTEYRRLFVVLNRIEARRQMLEQAVRAAAFYAISTSGKPTRAKRKTRSVHRKMLSEVLQHEQAEQERIEREGYLPLFRPPVDTPTPI